MNNIIEQWNKSAKKYTEHQEKSKNVDINKHLVMKRFSRLNGDKVLDLGCGYGFFTNYFKSIGANVIGIDGSEAMIELAKQQYPKCDFLVSDITQPLSFENDSFDIIFCNQVLMDVENIDFVFSECNRILKNNGILYYSIVHPVFYGCDWLETENGYKYAKIVEKYITNYELVNDFWGKTKHFHRPLSYYLNTASNNGLSLVNLQEPVIYDGQTKNSDLPLFLFAEYKKIN